MPVRESNIVYKGSLVYLRTCNTREWFYYDSHIRPLGAGAMGTVYQGRSCSNNHVFVAIKKVADKYAAIPAIRARARLEADLAFRHLNLIEMIGYCEDSPDSGPIYIISHLIQGVTLNHYVDSTLRNRPDWVQRICRCVFPVMDALTYLHGKNIIHMDIKPSNIMVENGSNIRLMDLGIAYTYEAISSVNGGLLGTPGYAAPEQYVSKGQTELPVNKTTDIYELGATLYVLLSGGHMPYGKDKEKLERIPNVPFSVMQVLAKSLKHNQEDRYQNAEDFKKALQEALNSTSSGSKIPHWIIWVTIGIVLLAVAILSIAL